MASDSTPFMKPGIATDVITENLATDISVCLQLQIYLNLKLYVFKENICNCKIGTNEAVVLSFYRTQLGHIGCLVLIR